MAATARVIDLESFRARRQAQATSTPVPAAKVVWVPVPVMVWFPMWRMVG
jgi:hypothetical protein